VWWVGVLQTFYGMFSTCHKMFVARAGRTRISDFENVYLSHGGLQRGRATVFDQDFTRGDSGDALVLRGSSLDLKPFAVERHHRLNVLPRRSAVPIRNYSLA